MHSVNPGKSNLDGCVFRHGIMKRGVLFLNRYIIAFFIFSFLGWVWESIYCTICSHKWINRGFLYGPICPIYGCGSLLGFLVYDLTKKGLLPDLEWWIIFILGFIVSMVLEYPTSWALERMFKARWWDYSKIPLNINGRTSVPTSIVFGGAAILVVKVLAPLVDKAVSSISEIILNIMVLLCVSFVSVDTTLTISALTDFQKRVASIDEAFKNRMTDIVNQVFNIQNYFYSKVIQRIAVFKLPERKNWIAKRLRENQFVELIKDYFKADVAKQTDEKIQYNTASTLEHKENVEWISYLINEKLHLNEDEKELVEAAMLHDLHLYDLRNINSEGKSDNTDKFDFAVNNAEKHTGIIEKEQETLQSHMWPLKIKAIPKNKEALIVYFADKYCALIEKIRSLKNHGLRK